MHTSESNGRTGEWSQVSPVVGEMHCSDVKQAESDGFLNILKNQSISNYQKKKKNNKTTSLFNWRGCQTASSFYSENW